MNTIVLSNVSVSLDIVEILYCEGILISRNIIEFLNNSYSKTVIVEVEYWQDSEYAYQIIKDLIHLGETEIETIYGIFKASTVEQDCFEEEDEEEEEEYEEEDEYEVQPNPICEEIDAYLQQMIDEDEAEWLEKYDRESSDDEMNREESYLYLDLTDLIGVECRM